MMVPRAGVEPARPNGHMALNHACLPIPAPGRLLKGWQKYNNNPKQKTELNSSP